MDPVVHFEMPYKDGARAAAFYAAAFGWKMTDLGAASGNYILATTAESDAKPGSAAGAINGGLYPFKPDWPMQYPSVVIGVEDIQKAMERIRVNGGRVLGEPILIPGFGDYVSFLDTEGNRHSIIQPLM